MDNATHVGDSWGFMAAATFHQALTPASQYFYAISTADQAVSLLKLRREDGALLQMMNRTLGKSCVAVCDVPKSLAVRPGRGGVCGVVITNNDYVLNGMMRDDYVHYVRRNNPNEIDVVNGRTMTAAGTFQSAHLRAIETVCAADGLLFGTRHPATTQRGALRQHG